MNEDFMNQSLSVLNRFQITKNWTITNKLIYTEAVTLVITLNKYQ